MTEPKKKPTNRCASGRCGPRPPVVIRAGKARTKYVGFMNFGYRPAPRSIKPTKPLEDSTDV